MSGRLWLRSPFDKLRVGGKPCPAASRLGPLQRGEGEKQLLDAGPAAEPGVRRGLYPLVLRPSKDERKAVAPLALRQAQGEREDMSGRFTPRPAPGGRRREAAS